MQQQQSQLLTPTKYKVSTITATGSLNTLVDLPAFYSEVEIVPYDSKQEGFVYIEFGVHKTESIYRGYNKKLAINRRKKKESKRFDNQVTVILRMGGDSYINVKVFKNGNVQMTGVKHVDQGIDVINKVVEQVRAIHERGVRIAQSIEMLNGSNYKVCLINSDFKLGMEIRRDRLNKLVQTEYGIYSSFEPCNYPGVKIQYYWNTDVGDGNGICTCSCACDGRGTGRGDGQCKKITIAAFQSGCVIITGAQLYAQIEDAYVFICALIQKHNVLLFKPKPAPPPPKEKEKEKEAKPKAAPKAKPPAKKKKSKSSKKSNRGRPKAQAKAL